MDDYISREAALEIVRKAYFDESPCPFEMTVRDILREIVYIPPANVSPVVRGEWIPYDPIHTDCMCCSECEWIVSPLDSEIFAFCPNCGADMRGDNNE